MFIEKYVDFAKERISLAWTVNTADVTSAYGHHVVQEVSEVGGGQEEGGEGRRRWEWREYYLS
jgi:hypothetical protein